jgi:hypothetical protein
MSKLEEMVSASFPEGSVCPLPEKWADLCRVLRLPNFGPFAPVDATAWNAISDEEKRFRFLIHLELAATRPPVFDIARDGVLRLTEDDWHFGDLPFFRASSEVPQDSFRPITPRIPPRPLPHVPRTNPHGDPAWLRETLDRALDEQWCIKVGCTTCGSYQFRRAIHGDPPSEHRSPPRSELTFARARFVVSSIARLDLEFPDTKADHYQHAIATALTWIRTKFGDRAERECSRC